MHALKEWATVVQALEAGEQTVLLRKGGILEAASGFVVESKKFLLFPTFEHQSEANIKPQFHKYLDFVRNNKPSEGSNIITSYAEILAEVDLISAEKIKNMSEFHIWSDQHIKTRVDWMPQKAVKAVFLKTYKIPPINVPIKPEYQGCKSWIDINANLESGKPVLSKLELESRLSRFREIADEIS
jgi:hypothetical protein